jgi:cytosine deaminase
LLSATYHRVAFQRLFDLWCSGLDDTATPALYTGRDPTVDTGNGVEYDLVVRDVSLLDGKRVDIAITGGTIAAVGEVPAGYERVVSGEGGLCVRPFTDSHLHLDKSGMAGEVRDSPSSIPEAIEATRRLKRRDAGSPRGLERRMISTLGGLESTGTRVVRAIVDVDETWGLAAFEAAKATQDVMTGRLDVRIIPFPQEGLTPAVADLLRRASEEGASAIGAHTDIDEDAEKHLTLAADIARRSGLPLEVHVDEGATADSFRLPLVLDVADDVEDLTLVHCLTLSTLPEAEQDFWIGRIKDRGARVVVAPSVLGFGLPLAPVARLIAAGVPILIGSDNLRDLFMPLGTGRLLDLVRIVALVGRVTSDEALTAVIQGVTNASFAAVTGTPGALIPGSPASLMILQAADVRSLIWGEDGVTGIVIEGEVREETQGETT